MAWTSIFLDEYNVHACLKDKDAVSTRLRVYEVEDTEYEHTGRVSRHDGGSIFYVSDEVHDWLTAHDARCAANVTLDFAMRSGENSILPGIPEQYGFLLSFRDPQLAMLFKLAWGGQ